MAAPAQEVSVVLAKLEWIEARQQERHLENKTRLERIEEQVRATNGRVNRHDTEILQLKLTQERDDRMARDADDDERDLENAPLSFKSAKAIAGMIAASLGALWWVMTQVMGFHR